MSNPTANITSPGNPPYLWEGEPKKRGTFGIISFCFSTLIICIWSTIHLNIPIRRYTATRRFFHQVFWMYIALLGPELLLYLAINEMITARILLSKVLKFHPHLAKPGMRAGMYNWICGLGESIAGMYDWICGLGESVAGMNNAIYGLRESITGMFSWIYGQAGSEDERYDLIAQTPQPRFGLVHAFYAIMGGFAFHGSYDDNHTVKDSLSQTSTYPCHIVEVPKFDTFIYIMKYFPHIITNITEECILDRAASSSLSKALLIVQVAWFCMSCASRIFEGLPLSLLEVSTAAHAFCTLVTYFVWWSKPLNVAAPTILREKEAQEVYALLKCSYYEYDRALEMARKRAAGDSSTPTELHTSEKLVLAAGALQHLLPTPERPPHSLRFNHRERRPVPGTFTNKSPNMQLSANTTLVISTLLYGLMHFLAWGNHFPTPLESLLWRVSSLVVTCSGLVGVSIGYLFLGLFEWHVISGFTSDLFMSAMCHIFVPFVHVLASGFLIVESFRQLFFLEPAAYQLPSWSQYWPRLS